MVKQVIPGSLCYLVRCEADRSIPNEQIASQTAETSTAKLWVTYTKLSQTPVMKPGGSTQGMDNGTEEQIFILERELDKREM